MDRRDIAEVSFSSIKEDDPYRASKLLQIERWCYVDELVCCTLLICSQHLKILGMFFFVRVSLFVRYPLPQDNLFILFDTIKSLLISVIK
jgi:hypothetical protein